MVESLDIFRRRGLRKILKITTTTYDRTHTNNFIYDRVAAVLKWRDTETDELGTGQATHRNIR
eukprot:2949842-Prorocentrum_lima.AAC.1